MIRWREKFVAFGIHFLLTLALGAFAAALIFLVWFPAPFAEMVGGTKLFFLVTGCDLALGPLISLVIYNSKKSKRELIIDYSLVAAVQLSALGYGLYMVSSSRPVYVAFVKDQMEVVTAQEIANTDLAEARRPAYRTLPKLGPKLIGTHVNPEDSQDALFAGLQGRDISVRPKFFVPFELVANDVKLKAQSLEVLEKKNPGAHDQIEKARLKLEPDHAHLGWLPTKHRNGFWTAIVDRDTGRPLTYINLDPY